MISIRAPLNFRELLTQPKTQYIFVVEKGANPSLFKCWFQHQGLKVIWKTLARMGKDFLFKKREFEKLFD